MKRIIQICLIFFLVFCSLGCNDISQKFKEKTAFSYETMLINGKEYISSGGSYYYDLNTYKYDKKTKTHSVDVLVDRDPTTDFGYYNYCPYDNGIITHILFNLSYSEITKKFKSEYKGFLSQKLIAMYEDNKPARDKFEPIKIYYDNSQELIPELQMHLNFFNDEIYHVNSSYKHDMLEYFHDLK